MKKLALFVVFTWAVLMASAQTQINWSIKFGLGFSNWIGDNSDDAKAKFDYKVGIGAEIPIDGMWSFQTGLNLMTKGVKGDISDADLTVTQRYLELPLMAALHLGTTNNFDVVLKAGPYIAYGIGGKMKVEYGGVETSIKTFGDATATIEGIEYSYSGLRRFDAGLEFGVDLDFRKWVIGIDSQLGLTKLQKGDAPRNLSFFVTAGYKF